MTSSIPSLGLAALIVGLFVAGCKRIEPLTEPDSSAVPNAEEVQRVTETGKAATEALIDSLVGQLTAALETGGPVQAMRICQQAALPMTAAAGAEFDDVQLIRATLKPRNPANAADEIDRVVLEKMTAETGETGAPPKVVIEWLDKKARYYQPLMIKPVCLNCHGDPKTFAPELVDALTELYPGDQATGYALGDLRGVIRVDIGR